jgi:hypothetical protein
VSALALVAAPREQRFEVSRPELEAWVDAVDPTDPDDAALAGRWLAQLPPGDGYLRDATLLGRPLGLAPAAVRCPVRLWAGDRDARVTVTPTTHLATLLRSWPDVLAWLVDPA